MNNSRFSRPDREVLSRGYREVTRLRAQSDELQRRLHDPRNQNRSRDVQALGTLAFHQRILRATIEVLEAAGSAE